MSLHDYYLDYRLPFSVYKPMQEVLESWAIEVVAIDSMSVDTMTEEDHTSLATREDARFLFKVELSADRWAAAKAIDEMLCEVYEALDA